ncbi:MAG: hypothetical protein QNK23_16465 [Crocinitomicaceae bacterium]|nr:hypothetical protein [Crocinitomicaceae bacterium]
MKFDHKEDTFCLQCGGQLEGRLDKKYCDRDCNNNYNNDKRRKKGSATKPYIRQFQNSQRSLELVYPESNGENYISLTKAIQKGLDLTAPCTKFKAEQLPYELIRIANYAYRIDPENHSIIIFKL